MTRISKLWSKFFLGINWHVIKSTINDLYASLDQLLILYKRPNNSSWFCTNPWIITWFLPIFGTAAGYPALDHHRIFTHPWNSSWVYIYGSSPDIYPSLEQQLGTHPWIITWFLPILGKAAGFERNLGSSPVLYPSLE